MTFNNLLFCAGKDEELLSTALGYIAHFVFLVAKYLNVNLRYAIVHLSSRSYMRDDVNDPHGEYPLYKRGVDKDRFDKAFLFLRKDVEQRLLEQAKASMVEQCALEVEATKTLLSERLRKEQRRHAKALEEREKRAEEFCTNLQAKYEDLMGVHEVTWQNQLHAMQQSMHTLLRTHMSLEDHELILTQKTTALNDAHAKAVQLLQTTFDRSMVEAQHVHERTAEAAHHVAVVPLHTTIAELQAKCEQAQAAVDDLTTQLAKTRERYQSEVLRRTKVEAKMHESCRHLLSMRNQLKKASGGIAEWKAQTKDWQRQASQGQADCTALKLTLVTAEATHGSTVKCLEQDIRYLEQALAKETSLRGQLAVATAAVTTCASSKGQVEARELMANQRLEQLQVNWDADVARRTLAAADEQDKLKLANECIDKLRGTVMDLQRDSQKLQASDVANKALRKENAALKQELRIEQQLFKGSTALK
ncbi:hypothetical protein DYB31_006485 [Aphanomyces astaci]|uniref:Uncharacterized protein n=1 Tax=Aphanomyces astaci TaxID=112090 RepID=A0A397EYA8_APHAT|nr:hypothetical protein DYB31_006485 [Aphanomyces astaci]